MPFVIGHPKFSFGNAIELKDLTILRVVKSKNPQQ